VLIWCADASEQDAGRSLPKALKARRRRRSCVVFIVDVHHALERGWAPRITEHYGAVAVNR
jgi:hypothetical protein